MARFSCWSMAWARPPWINKMLHNGAEQHCKHWGCQWDRDIEGIVKEVSCEVHIVACNAASKPEGYCLGYMGQLLSPCRHCAKSVLDKVPHNLLQQAKSVVQAGLEIEYISRWHFGTTYYIIARPTKPEVLIQSRTV